MAQFHTVIPLHHVNIDSQARWDFANGFVLAPLPEWCRGDEMLQRLSENDQRELEHITFCLIATYQGGALEEPDQTSAGTSGRSIQETKYEEAVLANLALWISRPSPAGFRLLFHAPHGDGTPAIQQIVRVSPLLCHPQDSAARTTADDIRCAAFLHQALVTVRRDTAVWTAIEAAWAALKMNHESIRYILFWIALEALFGPDDAREMTYRLGQRVGLFLGEDRAGARRIYEIAKRGYGLRSKIVHGHWSEDPEGEKRMAEAEDLVRQSLTRILKDAKLMEAFSGKARERFLDDLVFSDGSTA